jgi:hypothetical protein
VATRLTPEKAKKIIIARDYNGAERGLRTENNVQNFLAPGHKLTMHELRFKGNNKEPALIWKLSLEETPFSQSLMEAIELLRAALFPKVASPPEDPFPSRRAKRVSSTGAFQAGSKKYYTYCCGIDDSFSTLCKVLVR